MRIIRIAAEANGAHRNQSGGTVKAPEGWAVIPDEMLLPPSFPFVDIEVEEQTGTATVISMTAGEKPEADGTTILESEREAQDAYMVDTEYRLTLLELGLYE